MTEKGKLTKASFKARLAATEEGGIAVAEPGKTALLKKYLAFIEKESLAGKKAKDAQKALDAKVAAQYPQLNAADIQTLVVQDKWLAALTASVHSEQDRVSQALTGRIRQLAERYATPLPALCDEVEALAGRVNAHLKTMGFTL